MAETDAPPATTKTCSQCATPVTMPADGTSVRCPACGALVRTGEGTYYGLGWRFAIAGNVLFLVAAGFALLVAVNWLANKYFVRKDATFAKSYTLSETTKLLLQKVAEDEQKVEIYFLAAGGDWRTMEVVKHTVKLLEEYALRSEGMIQFQERSLMEGRRVIQEVCDRTNVKIEDLEPNEVLFYCEGTKKNKSVKFFELFEGGSGPYGGDDPESKYKFKGEAVLTASIQEVTETKKTLLYFVTGHGEYKLSDYDQAGLSDLDRQLKSRENYETKELNLGEGKVPEDASAIVIVRPMTKFSEREIDTLWKYLDNGGRMLLLVPSNRERPEGDPLEIDDLLPLLANWGVECPPTYVYERDPRFTSIEKGEGYQGEVFVTSTGPMVFNVVEYGWHDISRKLEGYQTWFILARQVKKAAQVPEGVTVTELAKSSPVSVALHESVRKGEPPPGSITPGPISVAVAAEKIAPGGGESAPKTRIVVIGDPEGISNEAFRQFGRNQLVTNSLRWIVGREHLISGIEPVETSDPKLNLTKQDKDRVRAITLIAMPGTFVLMAVAIWLLRRK